MSGKNVDPRTTTASNFAAARFLETVTNALEHAETLEWDVALGLPTRVEDANGRVLNLRHDALGRESSRERAWRGGDGRHWGGAPGAGARPVRHAPQGGLDGRRRRSAWPRRPVTSRSSARSAGKSSKSSSAYRSRGGCQHPRACTPSPREVREWQRRRQMD